MAIDFERKYNTNPEKAERHSKLKMLIPKGRA